jgi:predicted amidohydrolase YtcJ
LLADLHADMMLLGGSVITIDPRRPRAEAVAIRNGRILAVGSNNEIRTLRGPRTEVVELAGRTLLPGFNDAHNHMAGFGLQLRMVLLKFPAVRTVAELVVALQQRAKTQELGSWVMGAGYDNNKLPGAAHPTRWDLDRVSTDHFVYARHTSGHMCVVNSNVLALAGITHATPDPEGGHIVRDERGEPTGLLQETAQALVSSRFFPYPVESLVQALEAASSVYLSEGITSHTEAGIGYLSPVELLAYQEAVRQDRLQIRSYLMVKAEALYEVGGAAGEPFFGLGQGIRTGWGDERLRIGPIKMFSDGSLIGRTAAMKDPFATDPGNIGFYATPEATLRDWILRGHRSGWQIAIHAIGDRAVSYILDCYEEALRLYPRQNHRHRIEHCGVVSPAELDRIQRLGVIPVPQQRFISELGDGFRRNLGPERTRWCYPQRSYLERTIPMPGSSDRFVVDGAPLLGIHDAVNQKTLSGADYVPEERITPEEAIRAYTLHSAYASFEEHLKGSIEAGKLADLTILGADPTRVLCSEIATIPVQGTIVGGRLLHEIDLR